MYVAGHVNSTSPVNFVYTNYSALTISESHPFFKPGKRSKFARDSYKNLDIGGIFQQGSVTQELNFPEIHTDRSGISGPTWTVFDGHLMPITGPLQLPTAASIPPIDGGTSMAAKGTIAIARCAPTNPAAGFGQYSGEIHDLPRIKLKILGWRPRTHSIMNATRRYSNDYLNVVFGWKPFVKDIKDTVKALQDMDKIMTQYVRDNNQTVRRGYRFPIVRDTTTSVISNASYGNLPTAVVITPGIETQTVETTTETWFSGAFTYSIPVGKWARPLNLANHLIGLRLDPWLLYQLAPWTWALDWVTSIGAVVHNLNASLLDGLVLRYGYVMETKTIKTTITLSGIRIRGYPDPLSTSWTKYQVSKQRVRATPFGFGLNPTTFTGKQWAIVAALGISRAPRSLNF